MHLRGAAQCFAATLSATTHKDWTLFTLALSARFAPANRERFHKATFKVRRQKSEESFADLAHNLRRLAALGYPNAPHRIRSELARDQFVEAILNARLQQCLHEDPPDTLDDTVAHAVQLEVVWRTAPVVPRPHDSSAALLSTEILQWLH